MKETEVSSHVVVIRARSSWLHFDWKGLLEYRDLLGLLVRRDFTAKYKQTVLGPVWFFINPLITTLIFTLVFNRVIGVSTDGVPPMLFYLCGLMTWTYFSTVLASTSNSLAGNAGLFSKVYFPRLIPPMAMTVSALFALGIQLATFLFFYARYFWQAEAAPVSPPDWNWFLFPLLLLQTGVLGLGVGLLLSVATAKYRDLAHIQSFIVQLWMYATPVIYPMSKIPEQWRWVAQINPMSSVVEVSRHILLGVGVVNAQAIIVSATVSVVVLIIGLFAYQRAARTFVDTV